MVAPALALQTVLHRRTRQLRAVRLRRFATAARAGISPRVVKDELWLELQRRPPGCNVAFLTGQTQAP